MSPTFCHRLFANEGDRTEQQYWPLLKERFSNCERFWQQFIVPMTKRIELQKDDPERIRHRQQIAEDLWALSYVNYSLFHHLIAAYDHLQLPLSSSFGDFYTHLGSACDLAEDFLQRTYFIVATCRDQAIEVLQALPKVQFLELAGAWYDQHYPNLHEHYLKLGKGKPSIELPKRQNLIGEYFSEEPCWKAYENLAQKIRTYRNRIVHDVLIGTVVTQGSFRLVPKKEKITRYGNLQKVFDAAGNPRLLRTDFIVREEQMVNDFQAVLKRFNALWEKPIADLTKLLYRDQNRVLLAKFNLQFTEG